MRYILNINTRNFRKQLNINKYEVKLHVHVPPLSNIEKQYMNVHVEIFKIYKLIYTRLLYMKKNPVSEIFEHVSFSPDRMIKGTCWNSS